MYQRAGAIVFPQELVTSESLSVCMVVCLCVSMLHLRVCLCMEQLSSLRSWLMGQRKMRPMDDDFPLLG